MSRLRIRTLKPETWEEPDVGALSRDARLLMVGLITMADDDGRWLHLPSKIIGHAYPHDNDVTPTKLAKWCDELVCKGIVALYEEGGTTYGTFPSWHSHQRINRYTPSRLPQCNLTTVVVSERSKAA